MKLGWMAPGWDGMNLVCAFQNIISKLFVWNECVERASPSCVVLVRLPVEVPLTWIERLFFDGSQQ